MRKFLVLLLVLLLGAFSGLMFGCENKQQSTTSGSNNNVASSKYDFQIDLENPPADAHVSLDKNFYFVLDGSGSMDDAAKSGEDRKIVEAKAAIREFIQKVPANANIGLFVFDNGGYREVLALGKNNRDAFLKAVDAVDPDNNTPLQEAIETGVDKLVEQRKMQLGYGEFRLIVVTDGEANGKPMDGNYATSRAIPIYTIGFYLDARHELSKYSFSYRNATSREDLARNLEETLGELPSFDPASFEQPK